LPKPATPPAFNPLPARHTVASQVPADVLQTFVAALKGQEIEVTKANCPGFSALCDEFGFELLTPSFRLAQVEAAVERLQAAVGRLSDENAALRRERAAEQLSTKFDDLRREVSTLKTQLAGLPGVLDSRIISDFPEIFAEFQEKQFSLLWRGSRDGFEAQEFHRRCDGHANTLTVISDTDGNVFVTSISCPLSAATKVCKTSFTIEEPRLITGVDETKIGGLMFRELSQHSFFNFDPGDFLCGCQGVWDSS
jgi:hypothetical protein